MTNDSSREKTQLDTRSPQAAPDSSGTSTDSVSTVLQIPDHQLLRKIGAGSYGEVWLARNVMGTFRAVKVVYRKTFSNDRPYEREFSGIQKFEPISRSHEGLVDVLQIGRNDPAGYFYYVMELADDAATPVVAAPVKARSDHPNDSPHATNQEDQKGKRPGTGLPLTDQFRMGVGAMGAMAAGQLSPDGQRVLIASQDTARIWELPIVHLRAPDWLPGLAEAIAGQRLTDRGTTARVTVTEFLNFRQRLAEMTETNWYSGFSKWFFADRSSRTISPTSPVTVPEFVQRRIRDNSTESLREAVDLSPTNGLAVARLSRAIASQDYAQNPRKVGEAEFLSRRALELTPNDSEILRLRAEVEREIQDQRKP